MCDTGSSVAGCGEFAATDLNAALEGVSKQVREEARTLLPAPRLLAAHTFATNFLPRLGKLVDEAVNAPAATRTRGAPRTTRVSGTARAPKSSLQAGMASIARTRTAGIQTGPASIAV